jgi:hypothetical protein
MKFLDAIEIRQFVPIDCRILVVRAYSDPDAYDQRL